MSIPEPDDCPCGEFYQTRAHILRDCPRYDNYRYILREVSNTISIPDILGTDDGLIALSLFVEKTGAFSKTGILAHAPGPAA